MFSCTEGWYQAADIDIDSKAIELIKQVKSDYTVHDLKTMKYFLKDSYNDENKALLKWNEFVKWRQEIDADNISDDDIANELSTREAYWFGKDKKKRLCLFVTGRLHDVSAQTGSGKSFQKFLIRTVEDGLQRASQEDIDEVCVVYDRRGLEYEHIDPVLYNNCSAISNKLQKFYGSRMGSLYILHINALFWVLYAFLFKPLFGYFIGEKLVAMTSPSELLTYFDESDLPEGFLERGIESPVKMKDSDGGKEERLEEENQEVVLNKHSSLGQMADKCGGSSASSNNIDSNLNYVIQETSNIVMDRR